MSDKEHTDSVELNDELAKLKKNIVLFSRLILIIGILTCFAAILFLIIGIVKNDTVLKLCGGFLLFSSGWIFYNHNNNVK